MPYNTRDSMSSSSSKSSFSSSDCNKDPLPQGVGGAVSGVGSGARENGGVWGGYIVDGYGSVGSVITSVVVNIIVFLF